MAQHAAASHVHVHACAWVEAAHVEVGVRMAWHDSTWLAVTAQCATPPCIQTQGACKCPTSWFNCMAWYSIARPPPIYAHENTQRSGSMYVSLHGKACRPCHARIAMRIACDAACGRHQLSADYQMTQRYIFFASVRVHRGSCSLHLHIPWHPIIAMCMHHAWAESKHACLLAQDPRTPPVLKCPAHASMQLCVHAVVRQQRPCCRGECRARMHGHKVKHRTLSESSSSSSISSLDSSWGTLQLANALLGLSLQCHCAFSSRLSASSRGSRRHLLHESHCTQLTESAAGSELVSTLASALASSLTSVFSDML